MLMTLMMKETVNILSRSSRQFRCEANDVILILLFLIQLINCTFDLCCAIRQILSLYAILLCVVALACFVFCHHGLIIIISSCGVT